MPTNQTGGHAIWSAEEQIRPPGPVEGVHGIGRGFVCRKKKMTGALRNKTAQCFHCSIHPPRR